MANESGPSLVAWAERVRPIALRVAVVVATVEIVVWTLSFWAAGPVPDVGAFLVFPGFVLVFPLHLVAILRLGAFTARAVPIDPAASRRQRRRARNPLAQLTGWRRVVGAGGFALVVASFALNPLSGQPVARDGRYYESNHGEETEITRDEYRAGQSGGLRIFAAGSATFALLAVAVLSQPLPDRAAGEGDDDPLSPRRG